jgi:hypothetical protein
MKGRGNANVMKCMYHAWTYDLDGRLKGAPRLASEPGFRLENYPLLPVRAEALGPFVFVNLDRDAAPVEAYFGGVLADLARSVVHSRRYAMLIVGRGAHDRRCCAHPSMPAPRSSGEWPAAPGRRMWMARLSEHPLAAVDVDDRTGDGG